MKLSLALLAATLGLVAAEELGIEVTHAVECARKSKAGDAIEVHYSGTLASNGEKFDSSKEEGRGEGEYPGLYKLLLSFLLRLGRGCVSLDVKGREYRY
jgi:hypothetical protein